MKTTLLKITTALAGAGALGAAQAVPLDWTVDAALNLTDNSSLATIGHASLTGTFSYDADTNTLSNLNLQLTGDLTGSVVAMTLDTEGFYVSGGPNSWGDLQVTQENYLNPTPWATNAGGVVKLEGASQLARPSSRPGAFLILDTSQVNTVSSVSAVPEPQTVALMAAGLGALGAAVRRRRRTPA